MCGIIAIVRGAQDRASSNVEELAATLEALPGQLRIDPAVWPEAISSSADALEGVNRELRGTAGVRGLLADPDATQRVDMACDRLDALVVAAEEYLDDPAHGLAADLLEPTNSALLRCKDALWAISRDRLRAADGIRKLTTQVPGAAGIAVLLSLHQALSAIDRLEVRGRDSAGIEVQLTGHGLDASDPAVAEALASRSDSTFTNASVRLVDGVLVIVHKAAAEIGELGDNTAALRDSIRGDELLRAALSADDVQGVVVGHTRWASIGIVSEPNAHPQSSDELGTSGDGGGPLATAVLNGDVDNYAELSEAEALVLPPEVTCDAKVIPTLWRRAMTGSSTDPAGAFRETVARMEGSVAIAATTTEAPGEVELALRGSGQALYVGIADDAFIVASEPYGVVEETSTYLRLDGETPSDPDNPTATRGQVVSIRSDSVGSAESIARYSYDGTELPVGEDDLTVAEITTRDIDRGDFPHFLLKEVTDAPHSFRTTLRGRLIEQDGTWNVTIPEASLPAAIVGRLADGSIQRVLVIGQGTAAVAGQSLAGFLTELLVDTDVRVSALPATELSGFSMRADMSDALVVAISQSGTTTDTNRTVDLVRSRGAAVIAIVNRRGSDLTDKADGVLYTADGRDVEMSVASTKAFYSQVAAGMLLAYGIAAQIPGARSAQAPTEQKVLAAIADLPSLMEEVLSTRSAIAEAAAAHAPSRRYWALVGNGVNQIAARELRIKLSELCYKSIACDATEDKKHIDLSAEPMILVCAAGLTGSTADDVAKEVAIFAAHKAAPIVIASRSARAFDAGLAVLEVPDTHARLGFVLATMVGHLFGYEAALAIDAQAAPLRRARAAIDESVAEVDLTSEGEPVDGADILERLQPLLSECMSDWSRRLAAGSYNGQLEAATAVELSSLFRYAIGFAPLDGYEIEMGRAGTPGRVLDDLTEALGHAIDELTRPVDAIKHQAKTVTVGISRSDESLLTVALVDAAIRTGAGRELLPYATLRTLAELDPAVVSVIGHTRYRLDGGEDLSTATLEVVGRGGVGAELRSRTETDPRLRGTKALVARERELMVAAGRSDGRHVVIIPEVQNRIPVGLVLLHVELADHLPAATARSVLQGYRRRYQALRDAVTETEDELDDAILEAQPMLDLLTVPILDLADRWR
ncbi:MAG: SIS domain-containing protein [Microthrixaceae bacterium]